MDLKEKSMMNICNVSTAAMIRRFVAKMKTTLLQMGSSTRPNVNLNVNLSARFAGFGVLVVFAIVAAAAFFSAISASSFYAYSQSKLTGTAVSKADTGKTSNLQKLDQFSAKPERAGAWSIASLAAELLPTAMLSSAETIATFQSTDCATPKTQWDLGQTVCAAASGATGPRYIVWFAPNGIIAQVSTAYSGTANDQYVVPATGDFAQVGTWRVAVVNVDGDVIARAEFVIRDPAAASADLSIINSGQSRASAGDSIFYTVSVFNRGPDSAQNVQVTSSSPADATFVSASQTSGPTFSCPGATCTGTLAANEKATFTFVYVVSTSAPVGTIISTTASVSSNTNEPLSQRSDNDSTAQTSVDNLPTSSCTINCPAPISVNVAACSAVVTYSTPAATGNCTDPETGQTEPVACSPASGSAFPVGTTTVVCAAGGIDCSFTVTVNDTRTSTAPTITCPANMSAPETFPGSGSAEVNYPAPTTTGNCVTTVCDPPSGSSFPVGTTTVNCTATDPSNATATCSFTVTVTSNVCSPATLCPGNITVRNDEGQCGATVSFPAPPDACGTVTCTPASGSFFNVGTTTVNCTSSLGPSCSFTVTVEDLQAPTINCPADIVLYLPLNSTATSLAVNYPAVTASDNCPGTVTITTTHASGSVFPVGTTTVVATAKDAAGNETSCQFDVTVLYNFTGFFSPISNPPTINKVNAGRAIPVKFSLSGNKGLNIFAPGYPQVFEIDCSSGNVLEVTETLTAGNSSLTYDAGSDKYNYVWKTDASWAGTCRYLVVKLNDGTDHIAYFEFR
jgi:uncharacterized repeat protein (TIGR01451 family)